MRTATKSSEVMDHAIGSGGLRTQGKRPRIVTVLTRLAGGGPPLYVLKTNRALTRYGYETVLITGCCEEEDCDMSYLLAPSDRVCWVPEMSRSVSLWNDCRALWRIFWILRKLRPEIVHTHTAKAGAIGRIAAALAGVPCIVHTYHGTVFTGYFSNPVNILVRGCERLLGLLSDKVCALAPQQASELVTEFGIAPVSKVTVVRIGVDLEVFLKLGTKARTLADRRFSVAWFGRLVAVKDIPLLLSSIEETLKMSESVRFIIAGDGPLRADVTEAVRRFGPEKVLWLGWVRDISEVISQCDAVLLTSRNEGTPISLIQAMAAGRPFLSTAVGGVVDMVSGAAVRKSSWARWYPNCVLVDATAEAIANSVLELAKDPDLVARMGADARLYAAATYTLGQAVAASAQLYREVLARKRDLHCVELCQ